MESLPFVTREEIARSLREVGLGEGDLCLFHSSLKSFGIVDGGAQTVIDAFEEVLTSKGTLAVPTLCNVDFFNSYKTWYMDKPSGVGYLTEYFRKLPFVYRSDHPTHSVAARGPLAYELTYEHAWRGPHLCPFGNYAFADSSPWNKLYERNGKIVFLGVTMMYNTMKHWIEGCFVEGLLERVKDEVKRLELKSRLRTFESRDQGLWPFYNSERMQERLEEMGLVRTAQCGNARILCVDARDSSDAALKLLQTEPENWTKGAMLEWIRACQEA